MINISIENNNIMNNLKFLYETRLLHKYSAIKKYSVDIYNKVINIELDNNVNKNFGRFDKYVNIILDTIYHNYLDHLKANDEEKCFYDEIQLIGVLYVNSIEEVSQSLILQSKKSNTYDKYTLWEEWNRLKREEALKSEFGSYDRERRPFFLDDDNEIIIASINIGPTFVELMGCFIEKEHKILICKNNIKKFYNRLKYYDPWFNDDNYSIFESLVLYHEFGHSIFQYITKNKDNEPIFNERRANYFASYITNGQYDKYIDIKTQQQPYIYHYPLLSLDYWIKKYKLKVQYYGSNIKSWYEELVRDLYWR